MFNITETESYTTGELAKLLHVKPDTIIGWRKRKKFSLPCYKIGGAIRYDGMDVIIWLNARKF